MTLRKIFGILTCLLLSSSLFPQQYNWKKMDAFFDRLDEKQVVMGSMSIAIKDSVMYKRSIGYSDVQNNLLNNDSTIFRIGSISKTFTATIIMQLIEEGKLSMKTRLAEYYPDFTNSDSISIEQMLRHKSGLYNFTNSPAYIKWCVEPKSRDELLQIMRSMGVVFPPGDRFEYSNTNYVMLSFIAEDIENKSFAEILNERIIHPLQLKHTSYGDKIESEQNEAFSYTKLGVWDLSYETDMSIPIGAGAIVSNPTDLNSFYHALFLKNLVSDSSLSQMMDTSGGFGIGMFASPFHERTALGHTGGIDAFRNSADFFLQDSIFISYCSNASTVSMNDVMIGILSILFDREYKIPSYKPLYKVSQKQLDQYLGTYYCADIGMTFYVTRIEDQLIGRAEDQEAFPLEAYEKHKFQFKMAGVKIDFEPGKELLYLDQGGERFKFELKD